MGAFSQTYEKKRAAVEKAAGGLPISEYIAAKQAELAALRVGGGGGGGGGASAQ